MSLEYVKRLLGFNGIFIRWVHCKRGLNPCQDVQNTRKIIGEGPGFLGRLRSAVAAGHILPGIAAFAIASPLMHEGLQNDGG